MRHDLLVDVLHVISNAEKTGKRACVVPASSLVKDVLKVLQKELYIGKFEFIDDGKSGRLEIQLVGKINKSRAVKPRLPVKRNEYEKWETRYLPAKDFGLLIISTSKGVMTQKEAVKAGLGGRLLAYVY
ncbi:MAG: 30S ribosomal protein S8 [Candidatus Aenigmarchaeota archaeon]|nr:30S ribosomal protein S8 [Candidatus Aenigmarchaeota archaeon]